jgi:acyl-coenzyme A synthetase/AMP-(fatty) acid ligase
MNLAAEVFRKPHPGTALICGDERISYDELSTQVARAAGALRSLGVQPGERVLFVLRDTPEYAAAWLGAIHAGAVAIALNSKLPQADYRHILMDSGARFALVDDVFPAAHEVLGKVNVGLSNWRGRLSSASPVSAFDADAEAPALWLYSSGTTGRPKGIEHAHRAALSIGEAFRTLGLAQGERVFTTSKFFFAYGLEHGLLAPLAMGITSILSADWPDVEAVTRIVERDSPRRCSACRRFTGASSRSRRSMRFARCAISSPEESGRRRSSCSSGAKPPAESCSTCTACRKRSAPAS